ncbi:MAG: glycosyltransferase family 2 protein [Gemmatimonadota bacterium]|nr:glycosyltransferase family 2 protein [Gemmatimonadota bacterium]MDP6801880.1 glycosyltransferase family 2 protein [Gemmatimonadota bacterium]MDP7031606.1 glycosyltransferase family 2 protein [Gemmatimonadota bacterium]
MESLPDRPDVSVVIVNWRVRDLLDRCLETLLSRSPGVAMEVIVVDNDSGDGTMEMLAEKYPSVIGIQAGRNLGFSGGNNLGFARCSGRFVLLLNPDTEVSEGAVRILRDSLDSYPGTGAVGPMVRVPSGQIQLSCARRFPTLWNQVLEVTGLPHKFPHHPMTGQFRMGSWDHLDERFVEAVSGCCMMVRREIIEAVGGLDDSFFMYGEDLDLCWRVGREGMGIRYVPSANILHLSESSSSQVASRMFVETLESMNYFFRKNRGVTDALIYRCLMGSAALFWLILEGIRSCVVRGGKRALLRDEILPRYRDMLKWACGGFQRAGTPQ